jgi:hypothetical protein
MKEETKMLTALFLASALNDTLDDLEVSNAFVREFKRETKHYQKFLAKRIHKEIDATYETDPETFEEVQNVIDERAHNLSLEIINAFNRVIDEEA